MKCPDCLEEIPTESFPTNVKSITVVCHHCGCQMEVEKRPMMGWNWPKVTPRDKVGRK